jgi:hypothetical protein
MKGFVLRRKRQAGTCPGRALSDPWTNIRQRAALYEYSVLFLSPSPPVSRKGKGYFCASGGPAPRTSFSLRREGNQRFGGMDCAHGPGTAHWSSLPA